MIPIGVESELRCNEVVLRHGRTMIQSVPPGARANRRGLITPNVTNHCSSRCFGVPERFGWLSGDGGGGSLGARWSCSTTYERELTKDKHRFA